MVNIKPGLISARVMHKRLLPRQNSFVYRLFYLTLPLSQLDTKGLQQSLAINRKGVVSWLESDHGARDGSSVKVWIEQVLEAHQLQSLIDDVVLIAMPRIFGFVFNPVSFWFCIDDQQKLRAVLCEVNNTFGERHCYLCCHSDHRVIEPQDKLRAEKLFHVSPFIKREGHYLFRFDYRAEHFGVWIDYYTDDGKRQLLTALSGKVTPLTRRQVSLACWRHPLMTLRVVFLIHWQALKLFLKRIRFIKKPSQRDEVLTLTDEQPDSKH